MKGFVYIKNFPPYNNLRGDIISVEKVYKQIDSCGKFLPRGIVVFQSILNDMSIESWFEGDVLLIKYLLDESPRIEHFKLFEHQFMVKLHSGNIILVNEENLLRKQFTMSA